MKNKVGGFPEDQEFLDTARKYLDEATNNVINAFCDGFMLGRQHAEKLYGKEGEDKDED